MKRKLEVLFVVAREGHYWVGHRVGPLAEDLAFHVADDFNRRKNRRRFAALQHVQPVRSRRLREIARRAQRLAKAIQEYAAFHDGKGTIRLADGCSQEMAVENLIHEWAHLLRQLVPVGSERWLLHDAIYWAIYGQIIGAWHGE